MLVIDFSSPESDIQTIISDRNAPSWAVPVFDFIQAWIFDHDRSFDVKTSGSTGTPKEIQHSQVAMTASAERTCDFFDLQKGDTALLALPAQYIGGRMMIVRSIIRGLKLICVEPKSNPLAEPYFDGEIQFASFTPMQMSIILEDVNTASKLSWIRTIILGGGEVSPALKDKLQNIQPSVYETYGMTETISHIALKKINGIGRSDYFTTLDGVQISTDGRACLVIDAPHLTSEKIVTNDIVKIISDKEFLWIGRYDNVINTGGIKISAEEVERKLQLHINGNFFIAGIADNRLGQQVALVLESPSINEQKQEELSAIFATHLSRYEKPKNILAIEKFSYTENGKINKKATLDRINNL